MPHIESSQISNGFDYSQACACCFHHLSIHRTMCVDRAQLSGLVSTIFRLDRKLHDTVSFVSGVAEFGTLLQAPCGPLRAGALTVSETRIEGGDKAVQCHGTGEVQGVRVAYHRSRPCTFWFGIDSNVPGCQQVVFGGAWGRKRHREPDTGAQQDGPKRSREVS
eukprot:evm.model.scf_200EXC.3 EVM.evm.TU.scf_200EXC.3   scf_200EXC:18675-19644(-)